MEISLIIAIIATIASLISLFLKYTSSVKNRNSKNVIIKIKTKSGKTIQINSESLNGEDLEKIQKSIESLFEK